MASPGNRHCANCIDTLSFPIAGSTCGVSRKSQFTAPHQTRHRQDCLGVSGGRCELGIRRIRLVAAPAVG